MTTRTRSITDDRLAEWEALCNSATAGPWRVATYHCGNCGRIHVTETRMERETGEYGVVLSQWYPEIDECDEGIKPHDARLIVVARTALPALIAEVRAMRAHFAAQAATIAAAPDAPGVGVSE